MGTTKVVPVIEGEWNSELQEAIAVVAGKYGGRCEVPFQVNGPEVKNVVRELVVLFEPLGVRVKHEVRFIPLTGGTHFAGDFAGDALIFEGMRS